MRMPLAWFRRGHGARRCRSLTAAEPLAYADQRFAQTLGTDRFQEVVDRMHLECTQRVLIVGGRKYDRDLASNQIEDFEPVELRHLHVEEQQIRRQLRYGLHSFEAIGALRDDVHVWLGGEELAQDCPCQWFIVDDGDSQRK